MRTMKILFLASHWRVSLVRAFQEAKAGFDPAVELFCVDSDALAPSFKEADHSQVCPLFSDPECLQWLIRFCEAQKISALVPLTNKAIEFMQANRQELGVSVCRLWIPENHAIETCHDKWEFFEFLTTAGFVTPQTYLSGNMAVTPTFPLIAKPRRGEGSKNVFRVEDQTDLEFYMKKYPQHVFQQYVAGQEFSVDCFFDQNGLSRLIVPRERLAVRGGEVMASCIHMDSAIIDSVKSLGVKLGLTGPCTIQGILDKSGKFNFTDANLRFGSGFVHTISAGGDVPLQMYKELAGQELGSVRSKIKAHSMMTRFPENFFSHENLGS